MFWEVLVVYVIKAVRLEAVSEEFAEVEETVEVVRCAYMLELECELVGYSMHCALVCQTAQCLLSHQPARCVKLDYEQRL